MLASFFYNGEMPLADQMGNNIYILPRNLA